MIFVRHNTKWICKRICTRSIHFIINVSFQFLTWSTLMSPISSFFRMLTTGNALWAVVFKILWRTATLVRGKMNWISPLIIFFASNLQYRKFTYKSGDLRFVFVANKITYSGNMNVKEIFTNLSMPGGVSLFKMLHMLISTCLDEFPFPEGYIYSPLNACMCFPFQKATDTHLCMPAGVSLSRKLHILNPACFEVFPFQTATYLTPACLSRRLHILTLHAWRCFSF